MTWYYFIIGAIIAVWVPVLVLLILAAVRRLRPREPESEPIHPADPFATRAALYLSLVRKHLVFRRRKTPVGVVHQGATENYGTLLRNLRSLPVSLDLASTSEVDIRAEVHDALWDPISVAIDNFDAALEAVLDRLLVDDPQLRMRLPAAIYDTGQYDLAELEELLAEEVRV